MNKILSSVIVCLCLRGAISEHSAQAGYNPLPLLRSAAQQFHALTFIRDAAYRVQPMSCLRDIAFWMKKKGASSIKEITKQVIAQGVLTGILALYARRVAAASGRATESAALQKKDPAPCTPGEGLIAPDTVPAKIKDEIIELINQPDSLEKVGARLWRGILLTGPVGTGKTQLGYYIAKATNARVLYEGATGFIDAAQGSGSRSVHELFGRAQHKTFTEHCKNGFKRMLSFLHLRRPEPRKPTIVIVDEIDAIGRPRGGAISGLDRARAGERERALEQLLTELDGAHQQQTVPDVFFVATSNIPAHELDEALVRPGRLKVIEIPALDIQQRFAILKFHCDRLKQIKKPSDEVLRSFVENEAKNASGAELAHIINDASLRASRQDDPMITREALVQALTQYQKAEKTRREAQRTSSQQPVTISIPASMPNVHQVQAPDHSSQPIDLTQFTPIIVSGLKQAQQQASNLDVTQLTQVITSVLQLAHQQAPDHSSQPLTQSTPPLVAPILQSAQLHSTEADASTTSTPDSHKPKLATLQ